MRFLAMFHGDESDPRINPGAVVVQAPNLRMAQREVEAMLLAAPACTSVALYAPVSTHTKTTKVERVALNRVLFPVEVQKEGETK